MANKYPISTKEQLDLIEKVLGTDIEMNNLTPDIVNVFLMDVLGFTSIIKFTDYDCAIRFWMPIADKEFDRYPEFKKVVDQKRELFNAKEKELRKALRQYKKEIYGDAFSADCDRYNKTKKRLRDNIANNNRHIKQLNTQIDKLSKQKRAYQMHNQHITTQIYELEKE